jgi:hypothetical protein
VLLRIRVHDAHERLAKFLKLIIRNFGALDTLVSPNPLTRSDSLEYVFEGLAVPGSRIRERGGGNAPREENE